MKTILEELQLLKRYAPGNCLGIFLFKKEFLFTRMNFPGHQSLFPLRHATKYLSLDSPADETYSMLYIK